jgi:predicted dehydrogenase
MKKITRREFLENSTKALAGATAFIAGFETIGKKMAIAEKRISPNDKIHVALIGCGGMGKGNLYSFLRVPEIECLAVADVDAEHLEEGLQIVEDDRGNRPEGYKDFRRILDRKDIDAVIVAAPDHWHALPTINACQSGKDVYVEKPLATTIEEGRAMVTAARRNHRIVQVGTQQRSAGHFCDAVAFVKSGELGKLRMLRAWTYLDWKGSVGNPPDGSPPPHVDYDFWLGPAKKRPFNPIRFHHNFRWFWDYSGGLMTDWGAHMIDVVMWAMDEDPVGAMAMGGKYGFPDDIRETPDTQQSIVEFKSFSVAWEHMIGCGVGPWQREHGVEFHGENGILIVDRGGWEVHSETDQFKQAERVQRMAPILRKPASRDYHLAHVKNFVDCMKTRKKPVADVEIGHKSAIACHLANIAVRLRRYVRWDAGRERIIGDKRGQKLVVSHYRKPWTLPKG